jgi:MOSC domain-containing protein YiiM
MDIPALLMRRWQHVAVGVYAEVIVGGDLAVGDAVVPPAAGGT